MCGWLLPIESQLSQNVSILKRVDFMATNEMHFINTHDSFIRSYIVVYEVSCWFRLVDTL